MATIREQCMQALKARLAAISGLGLTGVHRSRMDKFAATESPALNLLPDNEDPSETTLGQVDARLAVEVQVYQRGAEPDRLADPIVQAVHAALLGEPTIGGLALDITENGTTWDFDATDSTALMVRMRFVVWHRHNRTTLAA